MPREMISGRAIRLDAIQEACCDLHRRLQLGGNTDVELIGDVLDELCSQVASMATALKEVEDARIERPLR